MRGGAPSAPCTASPMRAARNWRTGSPSCSVPRSRSTRSSRRLWRRWRSSPRRRCATCSSAGWQALEKALDQERAEIAQLTWLPRLFLLENEYHLALQEAELLWVRGLVRELQEGSFPLMKEWDHWTRTGEFPEGLADELYEAAGRDVPAAGSAAEAAAIRERPRAPGLTPGPAPAGKGAAELIQDASRPPARCGNT